MNRQLTISLFLCIPCGHLFAQRTMEGAYQGELIAPKSVLIISSQKDSILQGTVYSSQTEYFPFYGILSKGKIRGSIMLPPNSEDAVILKAELINDNLKTTLISSIDSVAFVESALVKVSKSPKYNLAKTFGKIEPQFDSLLVGRWETLYSLTPGGEKVDLPSEVENIIIEYHINGIETIQSALMDKLKAQTPIKQQIQIQSTWSTSGRKITTKTQIHIPSEIKSKMAQFGSPPPEYSEFTADYQIRGDTLIKTSPNGAKSFYIRK